MMVANTQPSIAKTKKSPEILPLPVEHSISGSQAEVFQATVAALEDGGFIINSVDSNSGFIRAASPIKDTRDFFENLAGEAEYESTAATITMLPGINGAYTIRLRLINNRTESQTGLGDFDQSGEQKFEKIDQSTKNYTRIFDLIDSRMVGLKDKVAPVGTVGAI
jgi:hypothetical protein